MTDRMDARKPDLIVETKLGLGVIAVLLLVLALVIYSKLSPARNDSIADRDESRSDGACAVPR